MGKQYTTEKEVPPTIHLVSQQNSSIAQVRWGDGENWNWMLNGKRCLIHEENLQGNELNSLLMESKPTKHVEDQVI